MLEGLLNRRHNELHASFGAGPSQESEQLRLLSCQPELVGQKDPHGNLSHAHNADDSPRV